jgi:hypothetical protein
MKAYNEQEIRDKVQKCLKTPDLIQHLYKEKFLNYSGNTKDTDKEYIEVIADELIKNYHEVSRQWDIPIRSTKSFNLNHDGFSNVKSRLNKFGSLKYCEKLLAIALSNSEKTYCLGKIKDYEVPLKEEKSDEQELGKIDLISVDNNDQFVKLIELKIKNDNGADETLLRAVLEIYTYYKLIISSKSQEKLLREYKLPEYYRLQPAILTDELALSGQQLLQMEQKYPRVKDLISAMNNEIGEQIEGYVYDYHSRGKPFQGITKDPQDSNQKIMLQGDITIRKIF